METKDMKTDSKRANKKSYSSTKVNPSKFVQPMFYSFLPLFKLQLRVCNYLRCIPYEWDEKSQRVVLIQSKRTLFIWQFQMFTHWIYTYLTGIHFFTPRSLESNETPKNLLGFFLFAINLAMTVMHYTYWRKYKEGRVLWNSFLEFEEKLLPPPDRKKPVDTVAKILLGFGALTCVALPMGLAFVVLVEPCLPPLLGHIFYNQGLNKCLHPPLPIRVGMFLLDMYIWTVTTTGACPYVFYGAFFLLICLDSYLKLLLRKYQRCSNLQEKLKGINIHEMYRQLQLLGRAYDSVFQELFLPSVFSGGIVLLISGLYTCIKLHEKIEMPGFLIFPMLAIDGLCVVNCTIMAAKICVKSKKFIAISHKSIIKGRTRQSACERRVLKSLDFMKIRFGSANFVDELTPLVFVDFAISQTVSLMLMS